MLVASDTVEFQNVFVPLQSGGMEITMATYYRITAYHPAEDFCFIVDSHGRFEKLWEFSSYLIGKGLKVLEVSNGDTFLDGNIHRAKEHPTFLYIQAARKGRPTMTNMVVDGKHLRAVEVCGRRYAPDRNGVIG